MEITTIVLLLSGTDSTIIGLQDEAQIILDVAKQYGLSEQQTLLLAALRPCENGLSGNEWGIASEDHDHRSHRYRNDARKSVRLQCRYAAGTIDKHYQTPSDLESFVKRWNPSGWQRELLNVKSKLEKVR